jgi:hypothetical protein
MHRLMDGPDAANDVGPINAEEALQPVQRSLERVSESAPDDSHRPLVEIKREFFAPTACGGRHRWYRH